MTTNHRPLRPPFQYMGGKSKHAAAIVSLITAVPYRLYVEPYGGSAAVLLAKPPSPEVYNDIDRNLYHFFRVIADPALFEHFYRRIACLPYHRALFDEARRTYQNATDPVTRAVLWFIAARQSFSGEIGHSWAHSITDATATRLKSPARWLSAIDRLPDIHARLQTVQFECLDALAVIAKYDRPDTLFYIDPPYPFDTRSRTYYRHEMTDADHDALLDTLATLKGYAILSSYPNPRYDTLIAQGWKRRTWSTIAHSHGMTRHTAATRRPPRTEALYLSPRTAAALAQAGRLTLAMDSEGEVAG